MSWLAGKRYHGPVLLTLLACGSPSVTVATSAHPDAPLPAALSELLELKIERPIATCYTTALQANADLEGTVTVSVYGSHGILKTEVTGGPEALAACVREPLESQKVMRALGDGDNAVGFGLTADFSKG